MHSKLTDDVIRVRVDTSACVGAFLDLLSHQAQEGETRAPAKPRSTAVFRELAPYRLVEYNYVDDGVGEVQGAYVAMPGGTVYSVSDEIPEEVIDALVEGELATLPPVYVFVVLEQPATPAAIDRFLSRLSRHLALPLVGVFRGEDAAMSAIGYGRDDLDEAVRLALSETSLHLTKEQVLDRHVRRSETPDGRAFARVTYGFLRHVVEFASAAQRDDFVAWSRGLCEWVSQGQVDWEGLGFGEIFRPAEPAPAPGPKFVVTTLQAPSAFQGGQPWTAMNARDAAGVAGYWRYVKNAIDANEAGFPHLDGWVVTG